MQKVKFGLVLPNRGPIVGLFTAQELILLAEAADDRFPAIDSVWVGDSILAKPRFECNTLLAAVAVRTRHVKLGPACFASFPLRQPMVTALEWASIDVLSKGRTIWPVCLGGNPKSGGDFLTEYQAFGVDPSDRVGRLEEGIEILKRVWTGNKVSFQGKHFSFENVTLEPKPVQKPRPPIWLVATPTRKKRPELVERMMRRVARHAEGWMTTRVSPEDFTFGLEKLHHFADQEGKDPDSFEPSLFYNVLIGENREAALQEAKQFLDTYYMTDFSRQVVELWTALGTAEQCVETINQFLVAGVRTLMVRFPCKKQLEQLDLFVSQVVPHLR
ncbi:LLM class flavin-dependent oxidoreductase [Acidobacteria bacterium AH-259-D05]|nr:LLM class flavin-dependent oxidoreductase [Acidobacteria bacterium AH-259-D05]